MDLILYLFNDIIDKMKLTDVETRNGIHKWNNMRGG